MTGKSWLKHSSRWEAFATRNMHQPCNLRVFWFCTSKVISFHLVLISLGLVVGNVGVWDCRKAQRVSLENKSMEQTIRIWIDLLWTNLWGAINPRHHTHDWPGHPPSWLKLGAACQYLGKSAGLNFSCRWRAKLVSSDHGFTPSPKVTSFQKLGFDLS